MIYKHRYMDGYEFAEAIMEAPAGTLFDCVFAYNDIDANNIYDDFYSVTKNKDGRVLIKAYKDAHRESRAFVPNNDSEISLEKQLGEFLEDYRNDTEFPSDRPYAIEIYKKNRKYIKNRGNASENPYYDYD